MIQDGPKWFKMVPAQFFIVTGKVFDQQGSSVWSSGHLVIYHLVIIPFTSDGWVVSRPHYYSADPSEPCVKTINRIIFDEKEIIEMIEV